MSARRSRASVACEKCRQRKVRCSISLTGVPCVSCTQDGSVCSVRPTKTNISGPLRRDTTAQSPAGNITRPNNGTSPIQYSNRATTTTYTSPNDHSHVQRISNLDSHSNNVHEPSEEHTGAQIVTAAIEQDDESNDLPFYIGMNKDSYSSPLIVQANLFIKARALDLVPYLSYVQMDSSQSVVMFSCLHTRLPCRTRILST